MRFATMPGSAKGFENVPDEPVLYDDLSVREHVDTRSSRSRAGV